MTDQLDRFLSQVGQSPLRLSQAAAQRGETFECPDCSGPARLFQRGSNRACPADWGCDWYIEAETDE